MTFRFTSLGLGLGLAVTVPALVVLAQSVVPTPPLVETLTPTTDKFAPDITIVSPQPDQTLPSSTVPLQISAKRFFPGKDSNTGLGLHFKVIVNNDPPIDYFDITQPLNLNLPPGTHTIRVVAARPWNQSYRNRPSFASVTFNVQQADKKNTPSFEPGIGLLTLVSPSANSYGAEPLLVDYIVHGVNLGRVAEIRYTLNGKVMKTTDRKPFYLTGLQPGQNTLVVELVDGRGKVRPNAGMNRVERSFTYQPGGRDTLSRLIRGELQPSEMAGALGPEPFIYDAAGAPRRLK